VISARRSYVRATCPRTRRLFPRILEREGLNNTVNSAGRSSATSLLEGADAGSGQFDAFGSLVTLPASSKPILQLIGTPTSPVPEPSSAALLAPGLAIVAGGYRAIKKRKIVQ
jgi:hypothetical protein